MNMKKTLLLCLLAALLLLVGCQQEDAPAVTTDPPETDPPVEQLTLVVTEDTISQLEAYPALKRLDLTGSTCYAAIAEYMEKHPNVEVTYSVQLGTAKAGSSDTALVLDPGACDYGTLSENLKYLPKVESVSMPRTTFSAEEIVALEGLYPQIAWDYTLILLGQELTSETTEVNLSVLEPQRVEEAAEKLGLFPNITNVELMDAYGQSGLSQEQVKTLQDGAPNAMFHYTFTLFGKTVSTTDERIEFVKEDIGNEGEEELRKALDILQGCSYLLLDDCGFDNEVLAQVREEFRDKAKLVWRVEFGGGSTFTDAQIIRSTYDLVDDNCHNLIYCEDARFIDIGHNEYLDAVPFVAGMPNLEVIIISGAPIKDLTPFENCKKLKVLEIAFCHYIEDIAPLASCEGLIRLNIGFTQVKDLSPLDNLNITNLCIDGAKVSAEERERFGTLKPDCWITYDDAQPYNDGWRYDEKGDYLPWYSQIRSLFRYDRDPHIPNNVGWYLPDDFVDVDVDVETAAAEPAETEEIPAETSPEEEAPAEKAPAGEAPTEAPPVETKPIIDLSPLL